MRHLVLWRHADAGEAQADPIADRLRPLSAIGRKQSRAMGRWLAAQLPDSRLVICSPAPRARQTAEALDASPRLDERLAPDRALADYLSVLAECGFGSAGGHGFPKLGDRASTGTAATRPALVIVAHQPTIGVLAHRLLCAAEGSLSVRKSAAWWFRLRDRDDAPIALHAVIGPDLLD